MGASRIVALLLFGSPHPCWPLVYGVRGFSHVRNPEQIAPRGVAHECTFHLTANNVSIGIGNMYLETFNTQWIYFQKLIFFFILHDINLLQFERFSK